MKNLKEQKGKQIYLNTYSEGIGNGYKVRTAERMGKTKCHDD